MRLYAHVHFPARWTMHACHAVFADRRARAQRHAGRASAVGVAARAGPPLRAGAEEDGAKAGGARGLGAGRRAAVKGAACVVEPLYAADRAED